MEAVSPAAGLKPMVRVVPFPSAEYREEDDSISAMNSDNALLANELDDYAQAYDELFDKEDGWCGFALATMFAAIAVHMWSQVFLSYLAWYPSLALASLVLLVLLSVCLYRFLEGQDDEEDDDVAALEELGLRSEEGGGVAPASTRSLIRAATILCARYPQYEEDELLIGSSSSSTRGSSSIVECDDSDEEDSTTCASTTCCLDDSSPQRFPSPGLSADAGHAKGEGVVRNLLSKSLRRRRLFCSNDSNCTSSNSTIASDTPPLTTVTAVTIPRFLPKRRRVRFDVTIESTEHSKDHWLNEKDTKDLWYSRQELRDLKRKLVFVDTQNAVATVSPFNWWRLQQFVSRWSKLRSPSVATSSSSSKPISPLSKFVEDWVFAWNNKRHPYQQSVGKDFRKHHHERSLIQLRARLAVAYVQAEGIVGLERILVQYHEESCTMVRKMVNDPATTPFSVQRADIMNYLRQEKNAEKIAVFHHQMSRPSCLFAREIALAQACALELL